MTSRVGLASDFERVLLSFYSRHYIFNQKRALDVELNEKPNCSPSMKSVFLCTRARASALEMRPDRRKHWIETPMGGQLVQGRRSTRHSTSKSNLVRLWRAEIYIACCPLPFPSPSLSLTLPLRPRNVFKNRLYESPRSTIPIVRTLFTFFL